MRVPAAHKWKWVGAIAGGPSKPVSRALDTRRVDHPDALELLRSLNMGLAMAHHPWYARIRGATTDLAYLRLLGRRDVFPDFGRIHKARDEELSEWAGFLRSLPPQVTRSFVFVNNQFEGHSRATVGRLRALLSA